MSKVPIAKVFSIEDRSLPIFAEVEDVTERIRERAFSLFAHHGFSGGTDMDDWFRAEREICWPAAQLSEKENEFALKVELPGFEPDDITVTANPRELIVRASHEFGRAEPQDSDEAIRWSEFRRDDVCRRVDLPFDIDVERVSAVFKRGLLTIEAPKKQSGRKGIIKVDISSAA